MLPHNSGSHSAHTRWSGESRKLSGCPTSRTRKHRAERSSPYARLADLVTLSRLSTIPQVPGRHLDQPLGIHVGQLANECNVQPMAFGAPQHKERPALVHGDSEDLDLALP
eukprot:6487685-Amphidinium_carterae.1